MAYKYGNREQVTFLPDSVEKYVPNVDPVRAYDAFINALSSKDLGLKIDRNAVGNSAYDPVAMLKILIYGYSYGWRSSRKLERALNHNLSFIWLSGGLKPDHKTISNFRKANKAVLEKILSQSARICFKLGLIEGNTLFVDGSKFRANAGNKEIRSKETWEKVQNSVKKRIKPLMNECRILDENESENLVKMNKELKNREKLNTKIKMILQEMNDEEKRNGTDADSKRMKSRQGFHAGFNSQIVTDEAHGLIVSVEVNAKVNDMNQLSNQIEHAENTLEKSCKNVCADAGYSSIDDLKKLVDLGRNIIVPTQKQALNTPKAEPFGKQMFNYDQKTDTYICPEGERLHRSHEHKRNNHTIYRMIKHTACGLCSHFGKCTSSKRGRSISRLKNEEIKKELEKIYESSEGQYIYAKRKMRVEHQFGHIKRNLGAGQFLLRGIKGVNAEFSLLASCFNITRMITLLGGVNPVIKSLQKLSI